METEAKVKYETIETLGVNDSVVSYQNDVKVTNMNSTEDIKTDEISKIRESKPSKIPLIDILNKKNDLRSETMPPSNLGDAEITISALEVDINNLSIHNEVEPQKLKKSDSAQSLGQSQVRTLFLILAFILLLVIFTIIIVSIFRGK